MKVILQVSTGLFGRCTAADTEDTGRRLENLFRRLPVRGVIYGWGKTDGLFERILEVTRRHGAEAWLWLPVFADIRDPAHADPLVLCGAENAGNVRTCPGEEFHFVCPGSEKNRNTSSSNIKDRVSENVEIFFSTNHHFNSRKYY